MAVAEICKAFIRFFYSKISVQITVGLLGRCHQINGPVSQGFQFRVWLDFQRIGYPLQPFGQIAVLKDHAVKFAVPLSCGDSKVLNTMAGCSAFHLIIQNLPLIAQNAATDQIDLISPKAAADMKLAVLFFLVALHHGKNLVSSYH